VPDDERDQPVAADIADDITDDELAALALAADPDTVVADDAVPFTSPDEPGLGLLPEWYMPAPSGRPSTSRTVVLAGVAIALFVINVGGVCVTYGLPDPVWK
jgi:hypothetical protein